MAGGVDLRAASTAHLSAAMLPTDRVSLVVFQRLRFDAHDTPLVRTPFGGARGLGVRHVGGGHIKPGSSDAHRRRIEPQNRPQIHRSLPFRAEGIAHKTLLFLDDLGCRLITDGVVDLTIDLAI
mgnify:CR=1 FL=1